MILCALAATLLPLPPPTESDFSAIAHPPGVQGHLLGTDQLGRDMLSRVVLGARVSLLVSLGAVALALLVGGIAGVVAGYRRESRFDAGLMILVDATLAFPPIVFIVVVVAVVGASIKTLVVGLAFVLLPTFVRLSRAATMALVPREFVKAAEASGATGPRVVWRELVPNASPPVLAYAVVAMSTAIVSEGTLSFLGLGVPPPTPSWGGMVASGLSELGDAPHVSLIPAAFLFATVLAINVVGEHRLAGSRQQVTLL